MCLIHLSTMRVIPLILSFISIYSSIRVLDQSLCDATSLQRSSDGKLNFAFFTEHHYHALDVPKVEGMILPSRNHCLKKCLKNPQCFSANVAAFHRPDGNLSCDLLPIDKYIAQDKFRRNHSFHHYSITSHCESFPCRNGGTCQPLYETDDYYCKCGKNFTGNHCERQRAIFVPDPVAFYPLNAKYATREFNNRQPQGTPVGVFLSPGPDGKPGGSYQFTGNVDSYIEFPNNGGLDVKYSMTLVFWVFPESLDGPLVLFSYFGTQMWFVFQGQLYIRLVRVGIDNVAPLMSSSVPLSQWYFVASSYDYNSGIGRLYVNGEKAVELNVGAGIEHATQYDIRMGAVPSDRRFFRGRIHGLQVYNVSLTKQQIGEVKEGAW